MQNASRNCIQNLEKIDYGNTFFMQLNYDDFNKKSNFKFNFGKKSMMNWQFINLTVTSEIERVLHDQFLI